MKKITLALLLVFISYPVFSCSCAMWVGGDGHVIIGRNMDWKEDMKSNMWVFPQGIMRDGLCGKNSLKWTSKYGSVVTTGYDVCTPDGLNEKGLFVNDLYLDESDYGIRDVNKPAIALSLWGQFFLDNFATVDEAVKYFEKNDIQVVTAEIAGPGSPVATLHISLGDPSGDNAIFEFLKGKLVVHHGKEFKIMTNSPPYDEQLALLKNYEGFGGKSPLPGTHQSNDRFVRASYYTAHLPADPKNENEAVAGILSVMRNVSQPFGTSDPARPNISSTIWRTVADVTYGVYFFESTTSPNIVWVKMSSLNFSKDAPVMKLDLVNNSDLIGDVSGKFVPTPSFEFKGS